MLDVEQEQMPAAIAPKRVEAPQHLVAAPTPKLARAFEPTLILPTGRFHRAAALRFAAPACHRVIHPVLVAGQIRQLRHHGLTLLFPQPFGQRAQVL